MPSQDCDGIFPLKISFFGGFHNRESGGNIYIRSVLRKSVFSVFPPEFKATLEHVKLLPSKMQAPYVPLLTDKETLPAMQDPPPQLVTLPLTVIGLLVNVAPSAGLAMLNVGVTLHRELD